MNIFVIFVAFSAGIILDAVYQYIRRENERLAFHDGYKQAQKEEEMRNEACERGRWNERYSHHIPVYTADSNQKFIQTPYSVPGQFMNNLHENGCATIKIK